MRTIYAILALMLVVSFSQAQNRKIWGLQGGTSGTSWTAKSYTNSLADTSIAIPTGNFSDIELIIEPKDSADVTVSFMPSYDGVTFYAKVAIGSAWQTILNGGNVKGFQIPAGYTGVQAVKWVLNFTSSGNGVTSATYNAKVVCKQ